MIMAGQTLVLGGRVSLLAARWSHAAIYAGNGMVIDGTYGVGVQKCSLWSYCHHRALTLMRIDDPDIPQADTDNIAACALRHLGEPYSVIELALSALGWPPAQMPNPGALFCSTFVGLVVAEATGIELGSDPQWQPLYPAMLEAHSELAAVPLEWRNI
jgi:cell wall-associated NlpC family hydrolase